MSTPNTNSNTKAQSTIARFDPIENSWRNLGNLNVGRRGHAVIQVGKEFIVVGGSGKSKRPTESCKLDGQSMICITREPELNKFSYPELMLMP